MVRVLAGDGHARPIPAGLTALFPPLRAAPFLRINTVKYLNWYVPWVTVGGVTQRTFSLLAAAISGTVDSQADSLDRRPAAGDIFVYA